MAEWDAELEVDPRALHRAAGSPNAWRRLASGWDCDAWLADESVLWRVPRRHAGVAALEREFALLPRIAAHLPAPVPVPERVEAPELPVLARHAYLPGDELASAPHVGSEVCAALGRFLRVLHSPEMAGLARDTVPVDPLGRADGAKRARLAHERLDGLADALDVGPPRGLVDAGAELSPAVEVLCHGDLHVRHVLLDDAGALAGVIDWGDACIGARAMDLAIVTAFDEAGRAAFARTYGPVPAEDWRFARMLAVMLGASLVAADPAGESGRGARRWLERLAEAGPAD